MAIPEQISVGIPEGISQRISGKFSEETNRKIFKNP